MSTTNDDTHADMHQLIAEAELGPARSITELGEGVLQVELDPTSPHKAATLACWLDYMALVDMTAGQYHARDPELRLNVRGHLPNGVVLVVTLAFHRHRESTQADLIRTQIQRQQIRKLVDRLAALDQQH